MKTALAISYWILLIFPITWIVLAHSWYFWTFQEYGWIPYNDYLYGIDKATPQGGKIEFFHNAGFDFSPLMIYNILVGFSLLAVHLLIGFFFKREHLRFKFVHLVPGVILVLIFISLLIYPVMSDYVNFIFD